MADVRQGAALLLIALLAGAGAPALASESQGLTLLAFSHEYAPGALSSGQPNVNAYVKLRNDGSKPTEGVPLTVYPASGAVTYRSTLPDLPIGTFWLVMPEEWVPSPVYCATLARAPLLASQQSFDEGTCSMGAPRLP